MTQIRPFIPWGPYPVPTWARNHVKGIDEDRLADFWNNTAGEAMASSKGCYIFALENGHSYRPIYVGKTTGTFRSECFADHKLRKVGNGLWDPSSRQPMRGTLVIFFFEYQDSRGRVNTRVIDALETFLIGACAKRNPRNLQNDRNAQNTVYYDIPGVINSGPGKPSKSATHARNLLGL